MNELYKYKYNLRFIERTFCFDTFLKINISIKIGTYKCDALHGNRKLEFLKVIELIILTILMIFYLEHELLFFFF